MKKRSPYPYLALALVLFALWNMSPTSSHWLRNGAATLSAPIWERVAAVQSTSDDSIAKQEVALLRAENSHLKLLIQQELALLGQLSLLPNAERLPEAIERHRDTLLRTLTQQLEGIPARVLYRSPATWNSSLWLNVGEQDNLALGRNVVAFNSVVLREGAVIGVVDYVGAKQCRVRLLTDVGLTPAVRAARGSWRDSWLSHQILLFQRQIAGRDDLLMSSDKDVFLAILATLVQRLQNETEGWLLAKGELQGSSSPLWRNPGLTLKGIGFNYDFGDEEGPSRDLRTGVINGKIPPEGEIALLKVKDLLVTTGYDGIFPAGLPIAEVTRISPLGEGDYYYELEAIPTAGSFVDIDVVCVLPPVAFDKNDQPPTVVW